MTFGTRAPYSASTRSAVPIGVAPPFAAYLVPKIPPHLVDAVGRHDAHLVGVLTTPTHLFACFCTGDVLDYPSEGGSPRLVPTADAFVDAVASDFARHLLGPKPRGVTVGDLVAQLDARALNGATISIPGVADFLRIKLAAATHTAPVCIADVLTRLDADKLG